ncbi:hypothetical protein [Phenylobacterium sp.]|uniref:hypothetical protein n=1 Tax=Phenylobacterium sp. TaxID=1871053 RepID=UPI0035B4EDF1
MFNREVVVAAAIALLVPAGADAQQRPKGSGQATCTCSCSTGPNGIYEMTYKAVANCSAYQGKTCNVEVSPNIIRSGTLTLCSSTPQSSSPAVPRGNLSLDPGKPQKPTRKIDAAPTTGAMEARPR